MKSLSNFSMICPKICMYKDKYIGNFTTAFIQPMKDVIFESDIFLIKSSHLNEWK